MNVLRRWVVVAAVMVTGCENRSPPVQHRLELRPTGPDLVELVPREGVPAFCLLFSISERGLIRQLTMNEENESFDCPSQKPVGQTPFRIPKAEGKVRIYAFFSDQKLKASSVAEQLTELAGAKFNLLDLRLPGKVVSDVVEYTP